MAKRHKSSAAHYAQTRRDEETHAREALKAILPSQMFTAELENNGDFNLTTKILVAAKQYIEDLKIDNRSTRDIVNSAQQESKMCEQNLDEISQNDRVSSDESQDPDQHGRQTSSSPDLSPFVEDIIAKTLQKLRELPVPDALDAKHGSHSMPQAGPPKPKNNPFLIPTTLPAHLRQDADIAFLRQVAQRLVHKAEEKVIFDGGMTDGFREHLEAACDVMIDEIEKIEELMKK